MKKETSHHKGFKNEQPKPFIRPEKSYSQHNDVFIKYKVKNNIEDDLKLSIYKNNGDCTNGYKYIDINDITKQKMCKNDSDSDDDVPLKLINNDDNSYNNLIKDSKQMCLFCDKCFNNRFNSIIHNAKHIIIPIFKHELPYCKLCSTYFTSQEKLQSHISKKHTIIPELHAVKTELHVKVEPMFCDTNEKLELKSVDINFMNDEFKDVDVNIDPVPVPSIKSRITFEDDDDDDDVDLISFTLDTTTKLSIGDTTAKSATHMPSQSPKIFQRMYTESMNYKEATTDNQTYNNDCSIALRTKAKPVHYDELMVEGNFNCDYCEAIFINRYELAKHKVSHISIKKPRLTLCPICDCYVAYKRCDVRIHMKKAHGVHKKKPTVNKKTCHICGLCYYDLLQHKAFYHRSIQCQMCDSSFFNETEMKTHNRKFHNKTKPYSNAERLKNIQNRIRLLNAINRIR